MGCSLEGWEGLFKQALAQASCKHVPWVCVFLLVWCNQQGIPKDRIVPILRWTTHTGASKNTGWLTPDLGQEGNTTCIITYLEKLLQSRLQVTPLYICLSE